VDAGDEFGDGSGLVALGLVSGRELEVHPYRIVDTRVEILKVRQARTKCADCLLHSE
jgi:hypothetical protein